jgi:hypothetical protein
METECSLPHSQVPVTYPYPEPHKSSSCSRPTSWRSILILSSHQCLRLPSGLFPTGSPTKILYAPLLSPTHATCPAQLTLLHFITRITFSGERWSYSSALCSLFHPSVNSSLLDRNMTLDIVSLNTLLPIHLSILANTHVYLLLQKRELGNSPESYIRTLLINF